MFPIQTYIKHLNGKGFIQFNISLLKKTLIDLKIYTYINVLVKIKKIMFVNWHLY